MEEIGRSPVEVGSWSHNLQGFIQSQVVHMFLPSTVSDNIQLTSHVPRSNLLMYYASGESTMFDHQQKLVVLSQSWSKWDTSLIFTFKF